MIQHAGRWPSHEFSIQGISITDKSGNLDVHLADHALHRFIDAQINILPLTCPSGQVVRRR
jgi:hypothetical protein